jgi:uncharacterized C2H2 Zn-finger protein
MSRVTLVDLSQLSQIATVSRLAQMSLLCKYYGNSRGRSAWPGHFDADRRSVTVRAVQAGYYCGVCDCILRDSASYLDHINGKYHNRALGMTMRVEKKGVSAVQQRLEMHRKRKEEQKREDYVPDGFEKRVTAAEAEERREKEERKARKKALQQKPQPEMATITDGAEEVDPDMAAALGFSGFGGK